jgi:hypothetical protein
VLSILNLRSLGEPSKAESVRDRTESLFDKIRSAVKFGAYVGDELLGSEDINKSVGEKGGSLRSVNVLVFETSLKNGGSFVRRKNKTLIFMKHMFERVIKAKIKT